MIFLTNDLQSKWGFSDGNILYYLIKEAIPNYRKKIKEEIKKGLPWKEAHTLLFSDDLLEIIVRKYILPKLSHKIVLQRFVGHNPVRAKIINGIEINCHNPSQKLKIEPKIIEIEDEIIIKEALKFWDNPHYLNVIRKKFPDQ